MTPRSQASSRRSATSWRPTPAKEATPRFSVRLLSGGPFVTMVDRFALAPLLIPIASDFHVPLGRVAGAATAYYLVYGLASPFWGFVSDRFGRIRIIRFSLGLAAAACVLSAAAPNVELLIAARLLDGMAVCAVLPTALVYLGDMVPFNLRHSVIADVLSAVAVGTTVGSLGAGLFAHFLSWRLMFLVPALIAVLLVFAMKRLPESSAPVPSGGPLRQIARAVRRPWARFVILFAIPEGAMVLGFIVYFAPAIESTGTNAALAGLVVASYGGAVLIGTQIVRRIASRTRPWVPMVIGGSMAVGGYLVAALDQHVVAILCASMLIGGCYSFFHSTLQAWATDIAPEVRGTAAALFVTGAFTGGAIGTGIGAMLVQAGHYRELFLVAAGLSLPVVIVATLARSRYPGTTLPAEAEIAVT